MSPVVVILTHLSDVHADAVQAHLDAAGVQVCRIDTATLGTPDLPVTAHLSAGTVIGELAGCDLSRVVGVWHRRPSEFATTDTDDTAELRAGIGGILAGLPYLNRPSDMAAAAFKPYQLVVAGQCGLAVPETLVSTLRADAVALADRYGGAVVVKPMSRRVAGLVSATDRAGWSRAIHLTQQRIDTTRHVRLTVVDDQLFAALIDSPHLDWRRDLDQCRYQEVATPMEVARPVRRLLASLRLRSAAVDFAVDTHGRWWFLEANPNGQWLWIEQATGLPIAAAVAAALLTATARPCGERGPHGPIPTMTN